MGCKQGSLGSHQSSIRPGGWDGTLDKSPLAHGPDPEAVGLERTWVQVGLTQHQVSTEAWGPLPCMDGQVAGAWSTTPASPAVRAGLFVPTFDKDSSPKFPMPDLKEIVAQTSCRCRHCSASERRWCPASSHISLTALLREVRLAPSLALPSPVSSSPSVLSSH